MSAVLEADGAGAGAGAKSVAPAPCTSERRANTGKQQSREAHRSIAHPVCFAAVPGRSQPASRPARPSCGLHSSCKYRAALCRLQQLGAKQGTRKGVGQCKAEIEEVQRRCDRGRACRRVCADFVQRPRRKLCFARGEVQSLLEPLQPLTRTWLHAQNEATQVYAATIVHLPPGAYIGSGAGTSTHMHASCFPPSAYLRSLPQYYTQAQARPPRSAR